MTYRYIIITFDFFDLIITFDNRGHYEEPKLAWTKSAGLTATLFLDSDKLGNQYRYDIFVGSVHNGHIYHFKLNQERNGLLLPEALPKDIFRTPLTSELRM
jgi:aldose sugar dehydrogenase